MALFVNLVVRLSTEIKKYIGTNRLQSIYIIPVINIYNPALNTIKQVEIYSMIKSNFKVSPKTDNANAERKAEPVVKADSAKIDPSAKAV